MIFPEIVSTAKKALLRKKGKNAVILDMRGTVGYTDFLIIASGESVMQVRAIAEEIMKDLKSEGYGLLHAEGYGDAGWTLLDYGELVVHVFLPEIRGFYALEELWADAPKNGIAETFD